MEISDKIIHDEMVALKRRLKNLKTEAQSLEHQIDKVYSSRAYSLWTAVLVMFSLLKKTTKVIITGKVFNTFTDLWHLYKTKPLQFWLKTQYVLQGERARKIRNIKNLFSHNLQDTHIHTAPVDIVIPWYGDLNIIPLLNRLNEESKTHLKNIIVVNDAYPNKEVVQQLENISKKIPRVVLITQQENQGFVGTANAGIAASKRDVLLLNSDVMPTEGWLDEILKVSVSNPKIATITPASNNATVFSVPKMNEVNEDDNPERTAEVLKRVATFDWCEVPTGHGFCMWIRRSALEECGIFDQETFGRGFGEENDLSQRFAEHGWLNVFTPKSYVMHYESMSFGNEARIAQIKENLPKVIERYPDYENDVWSFINSHPQKTTADLLQIFKKKFQLLKKPAVLLILHANPFTVIGGVEKETMGMLEYLEEYYSNHVKIVYFYHKARERYEIAILDQGKINMIWKVDASVGPEQILTWILQVFKPQLSLVEHLYNHSLEYGAILKDHKIPALLFIHDFYFFCQIPDLINQFGVFCHYEKNLSVCESCLLAQLPHHIPQAQWRSRCREILENEFDGIIFNSSFTLETYRSLYKLPKNARYSISYPDLGVVSKES